MKWILCQNIKRLYHSGFTRETDITQDIYMYKTSQDSLTMVSHRVGQRSMQKVSACLRLKGPAQGPELTAVCFASPYQEAHGSALEPEEYARRPKSLWRKLRVQVQAEWPGPEARRPSLSWRRRLELSRKTNKYSFLLYAGYLPLGDVLYTHTSSVHSSCTS